MNRDDNDDKYSGAMGHERDELRSAMRHAVPEDVPQHTVKCRRDDRCRCEP